MARLTGERFRVVYSLAGSEPVARRKAEEIRIEQTVEFPADLVGDEWIRDEVFGRVESFRRLAGERWEAVVSYAVEIAAGELTQFLNVVFGNTSLQPGVRVERLEVPESMRRAFGGPRFGRQGLRDLLGVPARPLVMTALKPMGLSPAALADLAYRFALGGIDLVKDDHGLSDQPFCRYRDRVAACAGAVRRANGETGGRTIYVPNVSAPSGEVVERARFAREAGAGGVMIAPGLCGFDTISLLQAAGLPVVAHPALLGSYVVRPEEGISHHALFGQILRLAGADAVVFPHEGGRFRFTAEDCRALAEGTGVPMDPVRPAFPVPAGGMSLDRVEEMIAFYGRDVVLLVGGALAAAGPDLVENCRAFRRRVEACGSATPRSPES